MSAPEPYPARRRLNDQPRVVAPWQWLARRSSGLTDLLADRARLGGDRSSRHATPVCAVCLDTGLVTSRDPYPSSDLTVTHGCPFGCGLPEADAQSIERCTVASLAAVQDVQR